MGVYWGQVENCAHSLKSHSFRQHGATSTDTSLIDITCGEAGLFCWVLSCHASARHLHFSADLVDLDYKTVGKPEAALTARRAECDAMRVAPSSQALQQDLMH